MFHHCNRWSSRYAYAFAGARPRNRSFYQPSNRNPHRTGAAHYESRRRGGHGQGGGGFGVRRPLRYLTYHLELDDRQVRHIAAIFDRLKLEREQASLDASRTVTRVASLVTNPEVSVDLLKEALAPRVASAEQLQLATARAIQDIVSELDAEQREEFAYLLNSQSFEI